MVGAGGSRPGGALDDSERLKLRLLSLDQARDDCALCFRFSRSPQFERRPDFLRLAREAFLKQTGSVHYDRFVLPTGDMVIIGDADLPQRVDTPLARVCDLAIADEADDTAPPLISYFDLTSQEDLDSLAEFATAAASGTALPPRKRRFTPSDVASVCARLTEVGVADLIRSQTAVSLGTSAGRPLFREVHVALSEMQRKFATEIEVGGRPLCRYLLEALDRCVLRCLPTLPDQRTDIPLSINLAFNTLSSPEFAAFRGANPFTPPLYAEIQIVDVLSAPAAFEALRSRLLASGVVLVVDGIPLSAIDHIDLSTLRPMLVKILWDQKKDPPAVKQRTLALRRAAAQIGRENVILCRVDSEEAIACALGAGVTRVQGRLIERLMAKVGAS
jgi:hypothetical protein